MSKTVRIGAHKYPLVYTDAVDGKDDAWGMVNFSNITIELSNDLLKDGMASKWAEILLHECSHAMIEESGIEFPSSEVEERCVTQLAKALAAFCRDNKTLVRAILKALK